MKEIQLIVVFFLILFLTSCMAKPNIRLNAGGVEMELMQPIPMIAPGDVSPDGKYVLTGGWKEGGFKLWDISKGVQLKKFNAEGTWNHPVYAVFSPDGRYVLSGGKMLKLWDLSSSKEVRTIVNLGTVTTPSFSSDGSKMASFLSNDAVTRFNFVMKFGIWGIDGREIMTFDEKDWTTTSSTIWPYKFGMALYSTALSPDGRYVVSGHAPVGGGMLGKIAKMILWDAVTGKKIQEFNASEGRSPPVVYSVSFSPDGKLALSGGSDGTVRLWNIISGTELKRMKGHSGGGTWYVGFSRDGKFILSGGADGLVKIWDAVSGAEIRTCTGYSGSSSSMIPNAVGYVAILPDGKRLVSMATDGAVRMWNASTGEEIALLIGFEDGEWLAITSEGYYNSSEKGAQYLKVTYEGQEYTVDQFYDVFYRPDIVAAKLDGQDINGLISITMKDARRSPPPLIEFTSQSAGTDRQKAKVCFRIKSTGGGIGEVRLFHNGKLIQSDGYYREVAKSTSAEKMQLASLNSRAIYDDMRNLTIKAKTDSTLSRAKPKGDVFEDCREIDVIPGDNEVSVTAFNSGNTIQSSMKTINFKSDARVEDPHLYILSIGIDRYRDNAVNLKYAVKDAKNFEEKLKAQSATLYKPQNIHYTLLTDDEASKGKITETISDLAARIKPQDGFILFVAGHGVLLQNQYYMLTHDFNGRVSDSNMISSNEIVEASKKIKSLSQLFIFDTCHAGGVDTIVSGLYDARMSVLAKKMGLHIYASASDKQTAMDGYKGNGLFTYTLLDGLNNNRGADKNKDGKVSVVGLGSYSKERTTQISKEIGHAQTPLIINFGRDYPIYQLR